MPGGDVETDHINHKLLSKNPLLSYTTPLNSTSDRVPVMKPSVAIVMGSKSDWPTMRKAAEMLKQLPEFEAKVVSGHRTPEPPTEFEKTAADEGIKVIIGGAGGAAHLPGMIAAHTSPVLGVPVRSSQLSGVDSLYSIVQMPKGVAAGTLAIGEAELQTLAFWLLKCLRLRIQS